MKDVRFEMPSQTDICKLYESALKAHQDAGWEINSKNIQRPDWLRTDAGLNSSPAISRGCLSRGSNKVCCHGNAYTLDTPWTLFDTP